MEEGAQGQHWYHMLALMAAAEVALPPVDRGADSGPELCMDRATATWSEAGAVQLSRALWLPGSHPASSGPGTRVARTLVVVNYKNIFEYKMEIKIYLSIRWK